jgi:hypothetical protein
LERALALVAKSRDRITRARIELALAEALLAGGGDEQRVQELAARARADARAAPQFALSPRLVAAADAILD